MRRLLAFLCLLTITAPIVGCGAHSSFSVDTDGTGSLRGLRTDPADGDDNVETDIHVQVYWVAGYEPPSEFTFRLRDEYGESVPTVKKSANDPNAWVFEPYQDLDYDSVYVIEITSADSERSFVFRTEEEGLLMAGSESVTKPKAPDPGDPKPELEHRIVTGH